MIDLATKVDFLATAGALLLLFLIAVGWLVWYVPHEITKDAEMLVEAGEEDEIA